MSFFVKTFGHDVWWRHLVVNEAKNKQFSDSETPEKWWKNKDKEVKLWVKPYMAIKF